MTAGRLLVRGIIRLRKVEHRKFEGHVTAERGRISQICPVKSWILSWSIIIHC